MSYRLAAFMVAAIALATGNALAAVTFLNDSKVMDSDWNVSTDGLNLAYNTSANETIVLDVGAWSLTINGNLIVGHNRLGTLNLGIDQSRVHKDLATGDNILFKFIQRGAVHHHQNIRVVYDGRADLPIAEDNIAVCRTATHFRAVRRKPTYLLIFS